MLQALFGILNIFAIMSRIRLGRSFWFWLHSCFGLRVLHLEGWCFNFWGSRLLLCLPLTVGLTLDALAYACPLDWELRFNLHMPRLPRLWVGGMYLYSPHSSHRFPFRTIAFVFRHFCLPEKYFPSSSLYSCDNVGRWEWSVVGAVSLWSA